MTPIRYQPGPRMSQAVAAAGLLFTAGQVAEGSDVGEQATRILAQIDALLGAAGTAKDHIVSASIWLADVGDFAAFNRVWDAWVAPGCAPARATVGAPLAGPAYRIEIAVIAAFPE